MADSDISAVEMLPEIQTMKVTDLRKKLKTFGLPCTGNKTELMERLQEAYTANKGLDSFDNSQLSFDESHISELESADGSSAIEDSTLLDQEQFSSYINSSLEDDSKALGSEHKLTIGTNSVNVSKPLKKRNISKSANENVITEKKVSLNRTNIAHAEFDIKSISNNKPETVIVNNKNGMEEKRVLSVKNMSAAERMAMRAKRFNISSTAVLSKSTNSLRNSKQSIISSVPIAPDLEVLKKRAERFGQSVSTVMKQIEEKEKLLKRKCKFGANLTVSATSSLDEQEKKKRRAERFGVS